MANAEDLLYGMITFSVILTVGLFMINSLNDGYADVNISSDSIEGLQNKSSFLAEATPGNNTGEAGKLQNLSRQQREEMFENEIGEEADISLIKGANKVYRLMKDTGSMVFGTIMYVGSELKMPVYLQIAAATTFFIFMTFLIVNMALRIFRG